MTSQIVTSLQALVQILNPYFNSKTINNLSKSNPLILLAFALKAVLMKEGSIVEVKNNPK